MKKKIVLIFLVLVLILLSFEGVLRLMYSQFGPPIHWSNEQEFELDPRLIYRGIANKDYTIKTSEYTEHVVTNSEGYRTHEFKPKQKNSFRIIVVGDSFTFGHGISSNDNTYPALIEKQLQSKFPNQNIEVLNLAIKGYSPDQEYRLILERVFQLEPNMIIWSLSNPGDMYNLTYMPGWQSPSLYNYAGGKLKDLDGRMNWMYIARWIKNNTPPLIHSSYLFNFSVYWVSQVPFTSNKQSDKYEVLIPWAINKVSFQINEIQKKCKKNDIQFVLAILPYPDIFITLEGRNKNKISLSHISALNTVIEKAQSNKISVIDTYSMVVNDTSATWKSLYYIRDYHPNDKGAAVFAGHIADRISSLVPLH